MTQRPPKLAATAPIPSARPKKGSKELRKGLLGVCLGVLRLDIADMEKSPSVMGRMGPRAPFGKVPYRGAYRGSYTGVI